MSTPSASTSTCSRWKGIWQRQVKARAVKVPFTGPKMLDHPSTETLYFPTWISKQLFFSYTMGKMTTTCFIRWICSQGVVTYVTLPIKIAWLSTQILIWNECLPICRQSPDRLYHIKPTGLAQLCGHFAVFLHTPGPTTAFKMFSCICRTYLSSKQPKSHINWGTT